MKLLIVDDSRIIRRTIQTIIKNSEANFTITGEAENGIEAVRAYKTKKPDIVTMDITMPEMDGLSAIEQILKFDPDAKILVVSALNAKETVIEAIKRGAKGYVLKPFTEDTFFDALMSIV